MFHVSGQAIWTPFRISDTLTDEERHRAGLPLLPDTSSQAALTDYVDRWSEVLREQEWLTTAVQVPSESFTQLQTVQQWQPEAGTLRDWLLASKWCEAADGCLITVSAACEHGYQSWAKELGYLD